jgi:hypothetical protein
MSIYDSGFLTLCSVYEDILSIPCIVNRNNVWLAMVAKAQVAIVSSAYEFKYLFIVELSDLYHHVPAGI